jgi:type I restriction enzyme M protein
MAKKNENGKEKSIEESLWWDSANKLRGSVEASEYKHVVLGLIFLKFASNKIEKHRQKLIDEGKEKYIDMPDFYGMSNVFYLDDVSRWSYIIKNSKQNDIALKIDTALHNIEKNNKALKGALPDNYFSRLGLDITKLSSLLDTINDIDTLKDKQQDIVGRVYEYFLSKFALAEGKGKGEFYTPKSIVNLIAEMIVPYGGIIYDPACGSSGMFVQSIKFIESHHGNKKDWRAENELNDDPRWRGYDVPPKSNANYGWILNMASKLSEDGTPGFVLANFGTITKRYFMN